MTQNINFIDIQRLPDQTIEQHRWLGLFEFVVKYRHTQNIVAFFEKAFPWISEIELHNGQEYSSIIVRYMFEQLDTADKELFIEAANRYLAEETRGEVMTLKQAFILEGEERGERRGEQRGERRGEQRGIQKGRLSALREMALKLWWKGFGKEEIASLTDIELHELEEFLKDADTAH